MDAGDQVGRRDVMNATGRKQEGQVLVQVAMLMVVFLAFMAIAIDVGNMLTERRRMQNAADAGALAGAWEICFGDPALAESSAQEYAITRNGAQVADVSIDGGEVTVYAREAASLYLARVFGINTAQINAVAVATCGDAASACGLWPIAFELGMWNKLNGLEEGWECGGTFYVWTGDNLLNVPDCENVYDCDVPDKDGNVDGKDDFVNVESRGWVDFSDIVNSEQYPDACSQTGCGENELVCWIREDSTTEVIEGDCVPGLQGVKAGVKDEVNGRIDDTVRIPIYDSKGCPEARYCPGGETYHIDHFGCIVVEGWIHNLELPRRDGANPPWKGPVIAAHVLCEGCPTDCGSSNGDRSPAGGVRAVSLIK
jgi:hypothetical protein